MNRMMQRESSISPMCHGRRCGSAWVTDAELSKRGFSSVLYKKKECEIPDMLTGAGDWGSSLFDFFLLVIAEAYNINIIGFRGSNGVRHDGMQRWARDRPFITLVFTGHGWRLNHYHVIVKTSSIDHPSELTKKDIQYYRNMKAGIPVPYIYDYDTKV